MVEKHSFFSMEDSCKEILKTNFEVHLSFSKVYLFLVYYYGSGYTALKGRMIEEE
jgi:hypothetical protein